jgi:hypothetical protein
MDLNMVNTVKLEVNVELDDEDEVTLQKMYEDKWPPHLTKESYDSYEAFVKALFISGGFTFLLNETRKFRLTDE